MKREKPYYPVRTKKKAVQMVAAGLLSEAEACQKFRINLKLLHQWQRWHYQYFLQPLLNPKPMAKKKLSDQEKIEQLLTPISVLLLSERYLHVFLVLSIRLLHINGHMTIFMVM